MSKLPQFQREGWRPHGPRRCRCPDCGTVTTTNALGRAAHARACHKKRRAAKQLPQPKESA